MCTNCLVVIVRVGVYIITTVLRKFGFALSLKKTFLVEQTGKKITLASRRLRRHGEDAVFRKWIATLPCRVCLQFRKSILLIIVDV